MANTWESLTWKLPETTLNPVYHRDNLKEVYEKIDRDIEEALPLVSDANYAVPKYHFNRSAAYAFATRFNLYYLKWEKVVEYASEVLGSAPSTVMRDWAAVKQLAWDGSVRTLDYISVGHSFNLLMIPMVTGNGSLFNAWSNSGARFTHNYRVAKRETYRAKRPMGGPWDRWKDNCIEKVYQHPPFIWQDNDVNKIYMPKWPNQWEVTDPVTGVGIGRSTMVAFTTNETVLSRAEAYVHLKEYDKAVADLNAWIGSFYLVGQNGIESLTRERIAEVYGDPSSDRYIAEYTALEPTSRKPLHPHGFTVEAGEQEHLIQTTLFCRRIETIADGLRWGDIKRYGIVIDRFDDSAYNDDNTTGFTVAATLGEKDLRRALQLPQEVITAGLEANPRNENRPDHPFCQ